MRVLVLCDVFPFPPHHGSSVISYNWARSLSSSHQVTLGSMAGADAAAVQRMIELGLTGVHAGIGQNEEGASIQGSLSALPGVVRRVANSAIRRKVTTIIEASKPDVIILIGPSLSGLLLADDGWPCPVVFVPYDAVSLNLKSRLAFFLNPRHATIAIALRQHPLLLAYYRVEAAKWARLERTTYRRANMCVAVSPLDADVMSSRWSEADKTRMRVIPNGVDLDYFSPGPAAEVNHRIALAGTIGSIESSASSLWFLRQVFPTVQSEVSDADVQIIGKNPPPAVLRHAGSAVSVTGFVKDVRSYIRSAAVSAAPLRLGWGIRNRVLEAMAMGKAVVASPAACGALGTTTGRDILIAESAAEFASAVTGLLRDPRRRALIGASARAYVETTHAWPIVARRIEETLTSAQLCGSAS